MDDSFLTKLGLLRAGCSWRSRFQQYAVYDDGGQLSFYIILGLLFATARKRNGWAGLHDLVSRTGVIRKAKLDTRPALAPTDVQPVTEAESMPRIGAYHVLEKLEQGKDDQWLLAYDARLLRKIWIHVMSEGTPEVDDQLRSLRRVGRLRWITGHRQGFRDLEQLFCAGCYPGIGS